MKIEKKIKNAYKNLKVPAPERVLPEPDSAAPEVKAHRFDIVRFLRPAVAAALLLCIIGAGVFGALSLRSTEPQTGLSGESGTDSEPKSGNEGASAEPGVYKDGVIGGRTSSEGSGGWSKGGFGFKGGSSGRYEDGSTAEAEAAEAPADWYAAKDSLGYDGEPGYYPGDQNNGITAGTLTARELRDVLNIKEWRSIAGGAEFASYAKLRGLDSKNVIEVKLTPAVINQKVELRTGSGETLYTARTDVFGKAYLVCPEKHVQNALYAVCGGAEHKITSLTDPVEFGIADGVAEAPKKLDLMLMIDTTGSMGDELEYLKVELADMVKRVAAQSNSIDIRISVNFYRDEGDEYVVKYFDFRTDVEECVAQLGEQHANGGGDYPEAVHTALENAVSGHDWRDDAVKLCFFVLDAPPHTEDEIPGITENLNESIKKASESGIKLIPVASSGIDKDTEFILRSFSVMTGGTYIYLTDDSGIGYGHTEATTSHPNDVEPLNECMIRVICEFCGLKAPKKTESEPAYREGRDEESVAVYLLDAIDMDCAGAASKEVAELRMLLNKLDYSADKVCDCVPTLRLAFSSGEIYEVKYHDGVCDGVCVYDDQGVLLQADCTEKAAELIGLVYSQAYSGAVFKDPDFGFAIYWNVYGDSSYDSRTGELVKSHIQPDTADYTATLVLSDEQLAAVKEIIEEADIASYPEEFTPYDDVDSTEMLYSTPYETIKIVLYDGEKTLSVCCDEICLSGSNVYSDRTKTFLQAAGEIVKIIIATPEWKSLPELVNLYE